MLVKHLLNVTCATDHMAEMINGLLLVFNYVSQSCFLHWCHIFRLTEPSSVRGENVFCVVFMQWYIEVDAH